MQNQIKTDRIMRIAHNAVNPDLRGKAVSIIGFEPATWWNNPRVIVRLLENDGSHGSTYHVQPGILINL